MVGVDQNVKKKDLSREISLHKAAKIIFRSNYDSKRRKIKFEAAPHISLVGQYEAKKSKTLNIFPIFT